MTSPPNRTEIEFFFSELKVPSDRELAYMVELMRSATNSMDLYRIFISIQELVRVSEDEDLFYVNHNSLIIFAFTQAAAQLREALKLFSKFSDTEYYSKLKLLCNKEAIDALAKVENLVTEWNEKKGFLFTTLKPVRDSTYHYDETKAKEWLVEMRKQEKERKPSFQTVDLEKQYYGPGVEYHASIFHNFLFMPGSEGIENIMRPLHQLFEGQTQILKAINVLVGKMLEIEGIQKRPERWFMKFMHGFVENS